MVLALEVSCCRSGWRMETWFNLWMEPLPGRRDEVGGGEHLRLS